MWSFFGRIYGEGKGWLITQMSQLCLANLIYERTATNSLLGPGLWETPILGRWTTWHKNDENVNITVYPANLLPRMFPGLWVLDRLDSVGYPFPRALLSGWHEEWAKGPFVIWWCSYLTRPFRGRRNSGDRESERGKNAPRNMGESKEKEERAKKYWGKK